MAPPEYGFNPSYGVDPFDAAFDPEEGSLLRQGDTARGFGDITAGHRSAELALSGQIAKAEDNAMSLLSQSLQKQADVMPEQGIAAALLAAIPTFGGYMIGKSVGRPELPAGYFEAGGTTKALGDTSSLGAGAGGLMGSQVGAKAAGGYIGALEADQAQKNDVLTKMAAIEQQRAGRLESRANSLESARLNLEGDLATIPLREASQIRIAEAGADASLANQKAIEDYRNSKEQLSPELMAVVRRELKIPEGTPIDSAQLRAVTAVVEAARKQQNQDTRLTGQNTIPPSVATKAAMTEVLKTKTIGNRYIDKFKTIAAKDPGYLERNIEQALPATELGALQKDLDLFAVQVRNAREAGVMTEPDFQRYSAYLKLGKLDTVASVLGRMNELQAVTDLAARAVLTSAKAGQENVSKYEELLGFDAPTTMGGGGGGASKLPGETKEQFIQRRVAEKLAAGKQ